MYKLFSSTIQLMGVWWKRTLWSLVHLHCGLVGDQGEGVRHEGGKHLVMLSLELMIDNLEVWDWERWGDQSEAELIWASAKWLLQGMKWNYFEDKKSFSTTSCHKLHSPMTAADTTDPNWLFGIFSTLSFRLFAFMSFCFDILLRLLQLNQPIPSGKFPLCFVWC